MSILPRFLLVGLYLAAAVAGAWYLPDRLPDSAGGALEGFSLVHGTAVLACLAVLHAAFAGLRVRAAARHEIAHLRHAYDDVTREIGFARAEARQIFEAIEATGKSGSGGKSMREVVSEVKVLKGLIERLYEGRTAAAEPALAGAEVGAAPPAMPVVARGLDDSRILEIVREGLRVNRVDLFLQPIVTLPQRRHRFYECLSRIRDGQGAMVVPEQYLPIAEREGLITAIDNLLLFRCVQLLRKTQRKDREVGFFCNISYHTLDDRHFFPEFIAFMAENVELAPNLCFEFVQEATAAMAPEVAENLLQLGDLGFRYSIERVTRLDLNYAELARRHFRFLKVDADVLLRHMRTLDAEDLVGEFRSLLGRSGIDLIAGKVEDEATLIELLDFGIDLAQGYLFGEPRLARES